MRILLYSQFCTPEPIFKSVPFARELIRRGHDVRILTGFPNYPGGKIFPGYKARLFFSETIDGVPVQRRWLYPSHDRSTVRRVANYLSFAATSAPTLHFGWKPDLVYVYNLVTLGFAAAACKLWRGVPFVLDVQDVWPESILQSAMLGNRIGRVAGVFCNMVYRSASRIVALSPGFKELLTTRGVRNSLIDVIYNWCDEKPADPAHIEEAKRELGDKHFNILFAGNMGPLQALEPVIRAAAEAATVNSRVRFVFMGKGTDLERLKDIANKLSPNNTLFLPYRPYERALGVLQAADVLLIHLKDNPLFSITIPSKTQAYLHAGKPILAAIGGDGANLVRMAEAGISCKPEDPNAIASAALTFAEMSKQKLNDLGLAGRRFYDQELSLRIGVDRFEQTFRKVLTE